MKFVGNSDNLPLIDNGNLEFIKWEYNCNINVFNMKLVHSDFYVNETALWNLKKQKTIWKDFEAQNHARYIPLNV